MEGMALDYLHKLLNYPITIKSQSFVNSILHTCKMDEGREWERINDYGLINYYLEDYYDSEKIEYRSHNRDH
jgi:hypothetical protein